MAMMYLYDGVKIPRSWKMIFVPSPKGYTLLEYCRSTNNPRQYPDVFADIHFGGLTWDSYYEAGWEDDVARIGNENIEAELAADAEFYLGDAGWEQIGDVLISRESILIELSNNQFGMNIYADLPNPVIGVMLSAGNHCDSRKRFAAAFHFANYQTRYISISRTGTQPREYREMLAADQYAREQLGLLPSPDYAGLILKQMKEQKRLAAEGK